MPLSHLLLLRRLLSQDTHLHKTRLFKRFSSLEANPANSEPPKPTSLSARMGFIFDQIDAIEKDRSQKDETLQRIRAWRESKKNKSNEQEMKIAEVSVKEEKVKVEEKGLGLNKGVDLVHPWPEWIELMERLVQQNYFDHKRKDEDKMIADFGSDNLEAIDNERVFDFMSDWNMVRTACLNFGRDRFDILRSLSRQDIQVLVGYGCPSTDNKVVFSAKLLRKHVHLDEGDVCSSCSLRNSCERGYLLTNKEHEARTIDIMRVLFTYGFHPVNGTVVNDSLLKKKSVKTIVRKLLHEVAKLSAVPIDPNLPPPIIKKPPPKVKQPPPPPKRRVGRDDIEMKKGDWLCPKCDFMNFAKNTVCLQCDAKRPKRQLLPGEWECPECNFLNYRRNMACFHCECKRPHDEYIENEMQDMNHRTRARPEKVPSRKEVSDAWNFDFDDNESDGADVAAFEYADSRRLDEDFPLGRKGDVENVRAEDGFYKNSRPGDREDLDLGPKKPGVGFDDFDDEEDDIDSYELEPQNGNQLRKSSSIAFSDLEVNSESEDSEYTNDNSNTRQRVTSPRNSKAPNSKPSRRKAAVSGLEGDELDFDSDDGLAVHPNWKSSHVTDSRQRSRGRGGISFGSDEDPGLSSGTEELGENDFPSRQNKGRGWSSSRSDSGKRGRNHNIDDEDFESDDEGERFSRDRSRGSKEVPDRRRNSLEARRGLNFSEDLRRGSHHTTGDKRNSFKDKFNRSSRGSRVDNRGFRGDDYDDRRTNARGGDSDNYRSPKRENFGNKQRGRFNNSGGSDSYLDDERYSRPRINVR